MKKLPVMLLSFVALIGCQVRNESSSVTRTSVATSAPAAQMEKYTNAQYRFSFEHPANWKVENGSEPESGYGIIAWIYTPQAAAALDACKETHEPSKWQLECGQANADSAIGVYDYGFIDYETLDETEKLNYQNYKKLDLNNFNAFEYTGRTQPPSEGFHVNSTDGKSGITFTVFSPNEEKLSVAKKILSTFKFTSKK